MSKGAKENTEAGLALYRKYRPDSFRDVIGQDHIVKVLESSAQNGKISHAYLFSGSRGTGKTSVARILAKEVGTSPADLYEIDAASNRGIDDVRELRENVRTVPFDSKYKVYIIDEVHMLTKEAFNALLKTLEEPPAHAIFILATTELEKVPDTIISRCQSFVFKKPNEAILKEVVRNIAEREGYTLADGSLELIATLGDGSFRDTQGILQKVLSFSKNKSIDEEEVELITGAPSSDLVNGVIVAMAEGELEKALTRVRTAVEQNIDMKMYMKLILQKFRYALMLRYAPEMKNDIKERISEGDFQILYDIALKKPATITTHSLETLLDAYQGIRYAFIPSLPLELALIKILANEK